MKGIRMESSGDSALFSGRNYDVPAAHPGESTCTHLQPQSYVSRGASASVRPRNQYVLEIMHVLDHSVRQELVVTELQWTVFPLVSACTRSLSGSLLPNGRRRHCIPWHSSPSILAVPAIQMRSIGVTSIHTTSRRSWPALSLTTGALGTAYALWDYSHLHWRIPGK